MARLLVIEDESEARVALSEALRRGGHSVLAFENGSVAVEAFKRNPADLVFCDLRMAGLDGLSVLRALKGMDPWISVIMMTAYGTIESVANMFQSGAYDVLEKPFTLSQIQQLARRALDHRKKLREITHVQGEPGIARDVPARLRELERLKADFLGMVMRDLKTPLQLLKEDIALIRRGYYNIRDKFRQQQLISRLERISTLMRRTAEGALAVFLSQEQRLNVSRCDVQKNLEEIVQMVRVICDDKKVEFRASSPVEPIVGETDVEKVRFIVEEILLQATEEAVAGERISFSFQPQDNGFRMELSLQRKIGLDSRKPWLSCHYVEILGGKMEVVSASNTCNKIVISIPWLKAAAA